MVLYRLHSPGGATAGVVVSFLALSSFDPGEQSQDIDRGIRGLQPGGQLHVADWGTPSNISMRIAFLSVRMLDGFKTTADNVNGLLPELFSTAGLEVAQESARYMTISGTLSLYRARKPR